MGKELDKQQINMVNISDLFCAPPTRTGTALDAQDELTTALK
jgi:hypothetical protein